MGTQEINNIAPDWAKACKNLGLVVPDRCPVRIAAYVNESLNLTGLLHDGHIIERGDSWGEWQVTNADNDYRMNCAPAYKIDLERKRDC